jgi:glucose/arabinose dehydrogenase
MSFPARAVLTVALVATLPACFAMRPSKGGGQAAFDPPRRAEPRSVALPAGYRIEVAATGLSLPTGVAFDDAGRVYVIEAGYSYGELWTTPRLVRVERDGRLTQIAAGTAKRPHQ